MFAVQLGEETATDLFVRDKDTHTHTLKKNSIRIKLMVQIIPGTIFKFRFFSFSKESVLA